MIPNHENSETQNSLRSPSIAPAPGRPVRVVVSRSPEGNIIGGSTVPKEASASGRRTSVPTAGDGSRQGATGGKTIPNENTQGKVARPRGEDGRQSQEPSIGEGKANSQAPGARVASQPPESQDAPRPRTFMRFHRPYSEAPEYIDSSSDGGSSDERQALRERHMSLADLGDVNDEDELPLVGDTQIKEELREVETKRKPFERGTNIVIFVSLGSLVIILLGFSLFRVFIGAGRGSERNTVVSSGLLEQAQDEKQQQIDELQAREALANQRQREEGINRRESPTTDSGLSQLLSPVNPASPASPASTPSATSTSPDESSRGTSPGEQRGNTPVAPEARSSAPEPSASAIPTPPRSTSRMNPSVPPPPPEIVVPPTPSPGQVELNYMQLRQNAQQFGSYGPGSRGNIGNPVVSDRGVLAMSPPGTMSTPPGWVNSSPTQLPAASVPVQPLQPPRSEYVLPRNSLPGAPSSMVEPGTGTVSAPREGTSQMPVAGNDVMQAQQQFLSGQRIVRPEPLQYVAPTQVLPGVSVEGKLLSVVYGTENWRDETSRYAVSVEQDIVGSNGQVVIPSGSIVMVELLNLLPGGLFVFRATNVVMNGRDVPLPPGVIDVRGQRNALIGRRMSVGETNTILDSLMLFGLGAAQTAAELANRPINTTTTSSGSGGSFSTFSSTTNPEVNYLAGAIQGGTSQLVPRLQQELQKRAQGQKPVVIYQLNAGTKVMIHVMRALTL